MEEEQLILPGTEPSALPADYWYTHPTTGEPLPAEDITAHMLTLQWQQLELLNIVAITFLVIYIFNTFIRRGRMR